MLVHHDPEPKDNTIHFQTGRLMKANGRVFLQTPQKPDGDRIVSPTTFITAEAQSTERAHTALTN